MKELVLEAIESNIESATAFIDRILEESGCSVNTRMLMDIALDELFCNIARYAYGDDKGYVTLRVETDRTEETASITFIDSGVPFDPLKRSDPDTTLSADERKIGGLGIYMVKKIMDEVIYKYENGCNMLRISKKL